MARLPDYYEILGVNRMADRNAIRSAYRRLARRYHPDVARDARNSSQFLRIQEAYQALSDPEKRRQYDREAPGRTDSARSTPRGGFHLDVNIFGIHIRVGAAVDALEDETDSPGPPTSKR